MKLRLRHIKMLSSMLKVGFKAAVKFLLDLCLQRYSFVVLAAVTLFLWVGLLSAVRIYPPLDAASNIVPVNHVDDINSAARVAYIKYLLGWLYYVRWAWILFFNALLTYFLKKFKNSPKKLYRFLFWVCMLLFNWQISLWLISNDISFFLFLYFFAYNGGFP